MFGDTGKAYMPDRWASWRDVQDENGQVTGSVCRGVIIGEERCGYARYKKGSGYTQGEEGDKGVSFRFAVGWFDGKSVKILDGGIRLHSALTSAVAGRDPSTLWVICHKSGSGPDTEFSCSTKDLNESQTKRVRTLRPPDIESECPWVDKEMPKIEQYDEFDDLGW